MENNRIEKIKEKLYELKNLDKGFSIFGSEKHNYNLNKTLSDIEIEQIEKENKIKIPVEYKNILKYLGNGGAGCGYGLESIRLEKIFPPYMGTDLILRNCKNPYIIECNMVNIDDISGYIKLFDFGCGMEYCIIVNGMEYGDLIFFDCDGRFEKIEDNTILDIYENWLDDSLNILKRIKRKLTKLSFQEVIDSEWNIKNYSVKQMINSLTINN